MANTASPKRKITFSLTAPGAGAVELLGDFTGWEQAPVALRPSKTGKWSKQLSLVPGRYEYRFRVDGQWCDDPACASRVPNGFGSENCVLVVE